MPLKTIVTKTCLPDSAGWYWFRLSPTDPWTPTQVMGGDEGLIARVLSEDEELTLALRDYEVQSLGGEWGDEIPLPKTARPASQTVVGTDSSGPRTRVHYTPPPDQKIDEKKFETFIYWIKERHNIWHKREVLGEAKPWTQDAILQSNFFCSPFRELDKTTVWFRKNIREPLADFPEVLMATIIYRWFNYIPTADALISTTPQTGNGTAHTAKRAQDAAKRAKTTRRPAGMGRMEKVITPDLGMFTNWDTPTAMSILSKLKQVFTAAFVVASGTGISKLDSICNTIGTLWADRQALYANLPTTSLQAAHAYLHDRIPHIGKFMAYELVCDLRFTHLLDEAPDTLSWGHAGPGAMRGINRLYNRPMSFSRESHDWSSDLLAVYSRTVKALKSDGFLLEQTKKSYFPFLNPELLGGPVPKGPSEFGLLPFELREVEHSLCEFDKYMRVLQPTTDEEYRPGDVPRNSKRKFKGTT